MEKLANETNPDQSARLESLEEEIGERRQLIEDISSGDFDGLLDDDEAVEAAGNILDLAASLPADYKKMRDRIEELVGELRNQIIEESLSKGATMAQVLEADKRLRQSPEGRTFRSFTAFLEDPQQQLRFRSAIGEVLSRQFADELSHEERETLKNLVAELPQPAQPDPADLRQAQRKPQHLRPERRLPPVGPAPQGPARGRAGHPLPALRARTPGPGPRPGAVQRRLRVPGHGQALRPGRVRRPAQAGGPHRVQRLGPGALAADRQGQARGHPRRRSPGPPPWPRPGRSCPAGERHINSIRALLSHALHDGAGFDRDAWEPLDFEQIDGTTRTAYLPVVTLKKD